MRFSISDPIYVTVFDIRPVYRCSSCFNINFIKLYASLIEQVQSKPRKQNRNIWGLVRDWLLTFGIGCYYLRLTVNI